MNQPHPDAEAAAALEQAIEKAKMVADDIRQAADDLAVTNVVLESELQDARTPEADQALDHTDAVERKLTRSAETLDEVNTVLDNVAAPGARP